MARVYETGNESNSTECSGLTMEATIQSIEILDGADTTYATGQVIQYVNLPQNAKFVDNTDIHNIDRLGRNIRVKVTFDIPGIHGFQIQIVPDPGNISYSATEKSKNDNYKYEDQPLSLDTDKNGELIIDGNNLFLDVAGNNLYKFKAWDCNNVEIATSAEIKTMRLLYYSEARMQGLTSALPTAQLASVEGEYLKHGLVLKRLNTFTIPLIENIGTRQEENVFFRSVSTATLNDKLAKTPYFFSIGYTGHLAKKGATSIISKYNTKVGSAAKVIGNVHNHNIIGSQYPLWHNITSTDQWYIDCYFLPKGKADIAANRINIPETNITPIQATDSNVGPGCCDKVEIDVSFLPASKGEITMEVYYCEYMRGGIGADGGDIVTICTKANWKASSQQNQIKAIIHEIGHMIGMTSKPNNVKRGLDVLPTWYEKTNAPSHNGDHCYSGISVGPPYDSATAVSQSKCVMYGAIANTSSFCSECSNRVRKTDLTTA
jgi:hypothetical protein